MELNQVPDLVWGACGVLGLVFLLCMVRMLLDCRRAVNQCVSFRKRFGEIRPRTNVNRWDGLSLEELEHLRVLSSTWSGRQQLWWSRLDGSLDCYSRGAGQTGWFLTNDVEELLPWQEVIDSEYHASFYEAVPSILTGLGLMATFVAILVALQGVHVSVRGDAENVQGIGTLINGLAGKFLCSIVALGLSVVFTFIEKRCEQRLMRAHLSLLSTVRSTMPVLSSSRILIDMQTAIQDQLDLMRVLYSEITERNSAVGSRTNSQ